MSLIVPVEQYFLIGAVLIGAEDEVVPSCLSQTGFCFRETCHLLLTAVLPQDLAAGWGYPPFRIHTFLEEAEWRNSANRGDDKCSPIFIEIRD